MNKDSLHFSIIDNGMRMSFTDWGYSMFRAGVSGVLAGREITVSRVSYAYPHGAMTWATEIFLKSGADRLIVIDTDQSFEPRDMALLLSHDVPLVAGMYVKKKPGCEFTLSPLDDENPFTEDVALANLNPLVEVARVSRGFISIHKSVFELMRPTVEVIQDTQTGTEIRDWWKPYPNGHSEDFAFCDRYRALGGKVYCDQRIRIGHWGPIQFPIPGTF